MSVFLIYMILCALCFHGCVALWLVLLFLQKSLCSTVLFCIHSNSLNLPFKYHSKTELESLFLVFCFLIFASLCGGQTKINIVILFARWIFIVIFSVTVAAVVCYCVRHSNEKFNKLNCIWMVFGWNQMVRIYLVLSLVWQFCGLSTQINHQQWTAPHQTKTVCISIFFLIFTNIVHTYKHSNPIALQLRLVYTNRLVESGYGCGLNTTCDTFETLNLIIFAQTSA